MDQARVEKYAGWLVQNKDKKGTKEFDTVATAYKALRSGNSSSAPPDLNSLPDVASGDVLPQAASNLLPSVGRALVSTAKGIVGAVSDPGTFLDNTAKLGTGEVTRGLQQVLPQSAQDYLNSGSLGNAAKLTPQTPWQQDALDQADATNQHLVDRYGSHINRTIANDPGGVLGDLAQVALLRRPSLATDAIGGVSKAAIDKARSINKLKVTYPEAATSVASDLKGSGFDLNTQSGNKYATSTAHSNNKVAINDLTATLKDQLDPQAEGISSTEKAQRIEAQKAITSAQSITNRQATPSQLDAVQSLVGDTQQGSELVHNLKKHIEIQRLHDNPVGGISQYTDEFNPTVNGKFGFKNSLATAITAGNLVHAGINPALGFPLLAAQAAIPVVGHLADRFVTGRRFTAQKLANDFGKTPPPAIGQGLTDVVAANEAARVAGLKASKDASDLQQQQASAAAAAKVADKQATADAKQQYSNAALENTQFNIARAAAAKKAQAQVAADKLKAAQDAAPKKVDLGINQVALNMVHQKMRANAAALQKSIDAANKVQNKAAAAAIGPKVLKAPEAAASAENAPVRNQAAYDRGTAHIQGQEATVEQAIKGTNLPHLKALLAEGKAQLGSHGLRGRKHHKQRMAFYAHHLKKAHTKHERTILNKVLKPLAHTFE